MSIFAIFLSEKFQVGERLTAVRFHLLVTKSGFTFSLSTCHQFTCFFKTLFSVLCYCCVEVYVE